MPQRQERQNETTDDSTGTQRRSVPQKDFPDLERLSLADASGLQQLVGNQAVGHLIAQRRMAPPEQSTAEDVTPEQINRVVRGGGKPLDEPILQRAEGATGMDLSHVRVHTGADAAASAAAMAARAYTIGSDIVVGSGGADEETLLHEAKHVEQQARGAVPGRSTAGGLQLSHPEDAAEREATQFAAQAVRNPRPAQAAAPLAGPGPSAGIQRRLAVQRARIGDIQPDVTQSQINHIRDWLTDAEFRVPAVVPVRDRVTRERTRNTNRNQDDRLQEVGTNEWVAQISWYDLIRGEPIRMPVDERDAFVRPQSGPVLGAAVTELLRETASGSPFGGDAALQTFGEHLMTWLLTKRAGAAGTVGVGVTATANEAGETGAYVEIVNRPGWNDTANEIVTGNREDRRHIIAWHTMRDAFRNMINEALRPGEDIRGRFRALIATLENAATWQQLQAAEDDAMSDAGNGGSQSAGQDEQDIEMGEAPSQPASQASDDAMSGIEMAPRRSASPANSQTHSVASTSSEELRTNLIDTVQRVLMLMNSNPFNLWAGDATANQSINRVHQQLAFEMNEHDDDQEMLTAVQDRAARAAGRATADRTVWTRVQETLAGVSAADARKFVQSIMDSFDIDVPVTGGDAPSSTYVTAENQRAAVRNVLSTGLAGEILAYASGELPSDFQSLIDALDDWLERFLRPQDLQTSMQGGRRTVGESGS